MDIAIGVLAVILIAILTQVHTGAESQSIAGAPAPFIPSNSIKGFQSVAFEAAPQFVENVVTFQEGPSTISKIYYGIPGYLWLCAIALIAVNIILSLVKIDLVETEQPNFLMNLFNPLTVVILVLDFLYLMLILTQMDSQFAVFYALLTIAPFAFLEMLQMYYKSGFNISVNDRIFGVVVTGSTQTLLVVVSTIATFLLMAFSRVNYQAFAAAIDETKIQQMLVVLPENRLWIAVPTFFFLLLASKLLLTLITWLNEGEINTSIDAINVSPRIFFSGMAVALIMISVFNGYAWTAYHEKTYTNQAPYIAAQLGITDEQAYDIISRSVADFATYGTWSAGITGTMIPADIAHAWTNWFA
jgi:hypothetical protein